MNNYKIITAFLLLFLISSNVFATNLEKNHSKKKTHKSGFQKLRKSQNRQTDVAKDTKKDNPQIAEAKKVDTPIENKNSILTIHLAQSTHHDDDKHSQSLGNKQYNFRFSPRY